LITPDRRTFKRFVGYLLTLKKAVVITKIHLVWNCGHWP